MTLLGLESEKLYKVSDSLLLWIQQIDDDGNVMGSMMFGLESAVRAEKIFLNTYSKKDKEWFATMFKTIEPVEMNSKQMFKLLFEETDNDLFNFFLKKLRKNLKRKWK